MIAPLANIPQTQSIFFPLPLVDKRQPVKYLKKSRSPENIFHWWWLFLFLFNVAASGYHPVMTV